MNDTNFVAVNDENAAKLRVGLLVYHTGFDEYGLVKELRTKFVIVETGDGEEDAFDLDNLIVPLKGSFADTMAVTTTALTSFLAADDAINLDAVNKALIAVNRAAGTLGSVRVRIGGKVFEVDNGPSGDGHFLSEVAEHARDASLELAMQMNHLALNGAEVVPAVGGAA